MAATTKNIGLTKPAEEEFYDINVQNGNMDIIDKEIGELKNPIFTSSDVADGEATEWTSVEVLTSKEKHTSVLAKISQMFKNIRFLNNKYKELNQSLTEKTLLISYNGLEIYKSSDGSISYKSDFTVVTNMESNKTNLINNTTWKCETENMLILPCRIANLNGSQLGIGFWIVNKTSLYFIPLISTTTSVKIVGSTVVN